MTDKTDMTAPQWAVAVPAARFQESRHELDERVLAVAPDYADAVRRELDQVATALRAPLVRPVGTTRWSRVLRRELLLFTTFTVGTSVLFAFADLAAAHPLVGALLLVSTACWGLWVWPVLRGRPLPDRNELYYAAGYQALVSVVVGGTMLEAAGADGLQPGWVVVCVLCAAVSVLVLFLLLRARTRPPRPSENREAQRRRRLSRLATATQAGQDRLLDAFERLPDEDREALQAEYAAALAVLRERGLDATPAGDEPLPGTALLERRAAEIARLEDELPPV